jgi:hypothetical protein
VAIQGATLDRSQLEVDRRRRQLEVRRVIDHRAASRAMG